MPLREVDEAQFNLGQRAQALLDALYTDADDGMAFKALLKKKFPKLSIPEIDAAKPHLDRMDKLEKEFADYRKKVEDDRLESDFTTRFRDVRREFSLTDEGLDEVKKRMVKDNIADPRAAAALVLHEKPRPVEPSGFSSSRWDLFSAPDKEQLDDLKSLINDPDAWMDRQIPKIIAEERNKASLPVAV